jgi:pilus assembly protein CpaC
VDGFAKYIKTSGDFQFLTIFHALEEQGLARTLASPNIVALSGDSASFIAGGEFPVPITRSSSDNSIAFTIEWKQFGIRLQALPTVLDSNRVQLYVEPEVSAPDYQHAVLLSGSLIPGIITRRVSTTVELKSGEVLVIGGVKSTESAQAGVQVPDPGRDSDSESTVQAHPYGSRGAGSGHDRLSGNHRNDGQDVAVPDSGRG